MNFINFGVNFRISVPKRGPGEPKSQKIVFFAIFVEREAGIFRVFKKVELLKFVVHFVDGLRALKPRTKNGFWGGQPPYPKKIKLLKFVVHFVDGLRALKPRTKSKTQKMAKNGKIRGFSWFFKNMKNMWNAWKHENHMKT